MVTKIVFLDGPFAGREELYSHQWATPPNGSTFHAAGVAYTGETDENVMRLKIDTHYGLAENIGDTNNPG